MTDNQDTWVLAGRMYRAAILDGGSFTLNMRELMGWFSEIFLG